MPVAIAAIAAVYLTVAFALFGRHKPHYSHVAHTISELGEIGAPHQKRVAFGVFLPVGLLTGIAGLLLYGDNSTAAALGFCISAAYLVAAFLPCDPGPPVVGSTRQGIHNLAAAAKYIGGGAALMAMAGPRSDWLHILGFVPLAVVFALMLAPESRLRGLIQRVAECVLFGGLIAAANPL